MKIKSQFSEEKSRLRYDPAANSDQFAISSFALSPSPLYILTNLIFMTNIKTVSKAIGNEHASFIVPEYKW